MIDQDTLLVSLRPQYADAILNGTKTVEVRRRKVAAPPGTQLILYATTPMKAIVGTARLQRTIVCTPETAWRNHGVSMGLEHREFEGYLLGRVTACLLLLENIRRLENPILLSELRRNQAFRPPQSYRYVSPADPPGIRALLPAQQL